MAKYKLYGGQIVVVSWAKSNTQICERCFKIKPLSEFPEKRIGHIWRCNECMKKINEEYYWKNKDTYGIRKTNYYSCLNCHRFVYERNGKIIHLHTNQNRCMLYAKPSIYDKNRCAFCDKIIIFDKIHYIHNKTKKSRCELYASF